MNHPVSVRAFCSALLALILLFCPLLAFGETLVTSFYPVWLFTRTLTAGIDGVEVINLTEPDTGCLHDYQLQPADMKKLSGADAFLINGAGMEAFLPMITGAFPSLPVLDASEGIELLDSGEVRMIGSSEEGEVNAHIWLDAGRAGRMMSNLATGLIRIMPEHADRINENLSAALLRLEALDTTLRDTLYVLPRKTVITFHEAFPYFGLAYGLDVISVGEEVSAADLAELADLVLSLGRPPLFVEPRFENLTARTLSADTGAPLLVLDPVVTGPEEVEPLEYYESVMLDNMRVLCEALGN